MHTIEIDDDVFAFLQNQAVPFVDDPNSVLRRLLLAETDSDGVSGDNDRANSQGQSTQSSHSSFHDTKAFVSNVLDSEFGGEFRKRGRFQYLFESAERLIYFQNFNQTGSDNLWYRLRNSALDALSSTSKNATICLTNPADNLFYALPVDEVKRRAQAAGWDREDLEVNIDHANRHWRELDWDIREYLNTNAA